LAFPTDTADPPELRRLLVVDDEEIVLVALRETLLRAGYEVVASGTATEALEKLRQQPFAVIITDQQMPRVTGLEFLAQAKEIQPDATRILITAVFNLGTVVEAINKGEIFRFIVKPWLREEFLAAVESAVQRHQLVAGNARLRAATQAMNDELMTLNRRLEEQVRKVAEQNHQLEQLNRALDQNLDRSVELCVRTMETFYPTLGSRARRVSELCRAMAPVAGLSPDEERALGVAARLHDIGLVGAPRRLIRQWEQQPDSLNDAERALIKQHPIMGQDLASFVEHLEAARSAIRTHHERFDGTGYPGGLRGSEIPRLGRLLAVAIAFAESDQEHAATLEGIRQGSGTAFDPEAVTVLERSIPSAALPRREREVALADLRPGMVLAKGIYTSSGILLVPSGHELNETSIDKLRHHDRISPLGQSLLVYC
jgi:response regulator RpfG family c-di-GMP phosphodiesterase